MSGVTCWAMPANVNPFAAAARTIGGLGGCPACHVPVPAERTVMSTPADAAACCSAASAVGDLQIFPRQTVKIVGVFKVRPS